MKNYGQSGMLAVWVLVMGLVIFGTGCGEARKHDCQQDGHEWVTARSGNTRCKKCGVYQAQGLNEAKK
jgi:hypothetical protein